MLPASVIEPLSHFSGTAVFVGGTGGIGRAIAIQLALHASHPCRIVLIGRNATSASSTISLMRASQKASHEYSFEACDVSTFENVWRTTEVLKGRLEMVDLLVLTAGFLTMRGRTENNEVEQVDTKMAAHFYSRLLFTRELLPLLSHSPHPRVLSILDPTHSPGKLDYDDLDLRRTFSLPKCATHTTTMTNVAFEDLAAKNPSMSFIHAYPGLVKTQLANSYPFPLRWAFQALLSLFGVSDVVCAEYMLRGCFDPGYERGFWRMDDKGEKVEKRMVESGEEARRRVGEHCDEVLARGL